MRPPSSTKRAVRRSATKRHLNTILSEDPRVTMHMTPGELARLFELMGYQGVAQTYIDRLIAIGRARAPSDHDAKQRRKQYASDRCQRRSDLRPGRGTGSSAPILILSNSLGTTLHMWEPQVGPFTQHFRLVRFDRRGHGKSGLPKGPYSMDLLGRDVLAIMDAARHQEGQLVRALDGRHGGHVARRQRAGALRAAGASRTRRAISPTRRAGTTASRWCATKACPRSLRPTWSAGSPRDSASAIPGAITRMMRCSRPLRSTATSPAAKLSATWTTANCSAGQRSPRWS